MTFLLVSKESSHAYDFCKSRLYRPRTRRIIRPIPRKSRLLRQIAERLPIDLDLFKLVSIKRIVQHDKVIGCGNAPITLGAYASREFFGRRYGRRVRLFLSHAFG